MSRRTFSHFAGASRTPEGQIETLIDFHCSPNCNSITDKALPSEVTTLTNFSLGSAMEKRFVQASRSRSRPFNNAHIPISESLRVGKSAWSTSPASRSPLGLPCVPLLGLCLLPRTWQNAVHHKHLCPWLQCRDKIFQNPCSFMIWVIVQDPS